jgi:hypothetical protein
VELGEKLSATLDDRRSKDAEQLVAELRPHASAVKLGPPVDGCFVNVSFLLGATERDDFEAALSGAPGENVRNAAYLVDAGRTEEFAALAWRLDAEAPGTRIELTGPWAPYSFALPDDEEPA